ncbi:MAG: right-handed parallel beta-helix repeat-containing protein, partial [Candidatus Thorarchaeota archaeon]|nr:right-handed parallel beta-helix repeat-containing protein [Candidatus Thorarchaeota archaeon]
MQTDTNPTKHQLLSGYSPGTLINVSNDAQLDALGLPGDGTKETPYIIQGYNYTDYVEDTALWFDGTTKYVTIRDCYFGGTGKVAIVLRFTDNIQIYNNTFDVGWRSIYTVDCENLNITWNQFPVSSAAIYYSPVTVFANNTIGPDGHYFHNATNSIIADNYGDRGGISIDTGTNVFFDNNTVGGKPIGYFEDLENTTIDGALYGQVIINWCSNVTLQGGSYDSMGRAVILINSKNCTIKSAVGIDCWSAIAVQMSNDSIVVDCVSYRSIRNPIYGVGMNTVINCEVVNCTFSDCGYYGANAYYSTNVSIHNNTMIDCGAGVYLHNSSIVDVFNNTLHSNLRGIEIYGCQEIDCFWNDITDSETYGVLTRSVLFSSVLVRENSIIGGPIGVHALECYYGPTIIANTIYDCTDSAINLEESTEVNVTSNNLYSNGLTMNIEAPLYLMHNFPLSMWEHNVSSNSVNGLDLIYLKGVSSTSVPSTAGQVWLVDCTDVSLSGMDVSHASFGVTGIYCDQISVNNILSEYNTYGTFFLHSDSTKISTSTFQYNMEGIYLVFCDYSTVDQCTCLHNDEQAAFAACFKSNFTNSEFGDNQGVGVGGSYGTVYHYGSHNSLVANNTYFGAWCGIIIQVSQNCTFIDNEISLTWHGLWLDRAFNTYAARIKINETKQPLNVWYSNNNTFNDMHIDGMQGYQSQWTYSIYFYLSNNTRIENSTILQYTTMYGYDIDTWNTTLRNVTIVGGITGLHSENTWGTTLDDCNFSGVPLAIEMLRSENASISLCNITSSVEGIHFEMSKYGNVSNNNISSAQTCVNLTSSRHMSVTSNELYDSGMSVYGTHEEHHHEITGNTIDGIPLGYIT